MTNDSAVNNSRSCRTRECSGRATDDDYCARCAARGNKWAAEILDKVFSHYTQREMHDMRVRNHIHRNGNCAGANKCRTLIAIEQQRPRA